MLFFLAQQPSNYIKYAIMKNYKLLSGNEALAQGAYEAGLKFAASYPGTPATDI